MDLVSEFSVEFFFLLFCAMFLGVLFYFMLGEK